MTRRLRLVPAQARWLAPWFFSFVLAACTEEPERKAASPPPAVTQAEDACVERSFEGSPFTVCRFDGRHHEIALHWKDREGRPLRSLARLSEDLGKDAARVAFAMNAGMYDEAGAPIGLYVEEGEELKALNLNEGPGNFHMMPNGVFAVGRDGALSVTPSDRFAEEVPDPLWATQSGPMLVIDGEIHPRFDHDGQSRFVRNGVGVCGKGVALFAMSEEGVSFGRFARFFRDELQCRDALFLDGTVSSLWAPSIGRTDDNHELGPMIVVLDRR